MDWGPNQSRLTQRLIDSLYTESMLLADEARAYFDENGRDDREMLDPMLRVGFSCESLKVTTRLMHVIAWLLTQRAIETGELSPIQGRHPSRRVGHAAASDDTLVVRLPDDARGLIEASIDLYERVKRIDRGLVPGEAPQSPAHGLMRRLEAAF
jgi:regulator of CtrA degradation